MSQRSKAIQRSRLTSSMGGVLRKAWNEQCAYMTDEGRERLRFLGSLLLKEILTKNSSSSVVDILLYNMVFETTEKNLKYLLYFYPDDAEQERFEYRVDPHVSAAGIHFLLQRTLARKGGVLKIARPMGSQRKEE